MHSMYNLKLSFFFSSALQDRVRLTVTSASLDHEIWLPFMTPGELTAERIMIEVERVIQSNDEWLFEGHFVITFIHAPLPAGQGYGKHATRLQTLLHQKRCIIQIPVKKDNLCCAKAIITAKAHVEKHPQWNSIRQGCSIQATLAKTLHKQAGIPFGKPCGIDEWRKFQRVLQGYRLSIVSRDHFKGTL